MKKIFLFIALICFLSVVNALEESPFPKEDFSQRMNNAISHNRLQVNLRTPTDELGQINQELLELNEQKLAKLDELKEQAVKEYSVFFDAYYAGDSVKAHEQIDKLTSILDEMSSLMITIVKFDEIKANIFYWGIHLDNLIKQGVFIDDNNTDSRTIQAIKEKTGFDSNVSDPDKNQFKPGDGKGFDLLIPFAVVLVLIVFGIIYFIFMKR
ncbi:MAG: hypothetical protein ABH986_06725 [archaeon]